MGQTTPVSLTLTPRCQVSSSHAENESRKRLESSSGEELLLSLQPQLPTQTYSTDAGQKGREGRRRELLIMALGNGKRNQEGKEGHLHVYRLHTDWDEEMAGTGLEARPQNALFSLQWRQSQCLIPQETCSGKQSQKCRLPPASF